MATITIAGEFVRINNEIFRLHDIKHVKVRQNDNGQWQFILKLDEQWTWTLSSESDARQMLDDLWNRINEYVIQEIP